MKSCLDNGKIPTDFPATSANLGMVNHSKRTTDLALNVGPCLHPLKLRGIKGVSVKWASLQLGQRGFMRRDSQRILWIDFLADSRKMLELVKYRIDLA